MVSLSEIVPGIPVAVFYSDDLVWHERIPIWRASEGHWMIVTPDSDRYVEDLRGGSLEGPSKVKIKGKDFKYWSRVGGAAHRFASGLTNEEFRSHIKNSFKELLSEPDFDRDWRPDVIIDMDGKVHQSSDFLGGMLTTHRLTGKRGVMVQPDPSSPASRQQALMSSIQPIALPGSGYLWVCCESRDGHQIGEVMEVDGNRDVMLGDIGLFQSPSGWIKLQRLTEPERLKLVPAADLAAASDQRPSPKASGTTEVNDEEAGDARTLFIDFDEQGSRFKLWRNVVLESKDYSYTDWPFEGPSTVMHLLKQMHRNGGDARLWLQLWARQKNIQDSDRVMHEMRCLTDVLFHGATFDQLNLPVLASMETVARRIQCIVEAYAAGSGTPDWSNAKLYTCHTGPDDLVSPQLRSWAARRGKEEVELAAARARMKELRKLPLSTEEAAVAASDGVLPGAQPNRRGRGRGRGLEAPKES